MADPVTLRPYQNTALDEIRAAIRAGHKRILLQLPTGAGKTLTAAAMIVGALTKGNRTLFAMHRLELIDQSVRAMVSMGITTIGVVRAKDKRRDPSQPLQVCSIQTLARRSPVADVRFVIIDEAHRSLSKTYVTRLLEAYPDAIFIGLTATPCRTDGKPLGSRWTHMVQVVHYSQLIAEGYLVAPTVYSTPVLPDLSTVRTVAGDYNAEDLEAAVNRRALIGNLLVEWQKRGRGLRTVAFAVSVAHSLAIVEMFREAGVRAEHLDGETPEVDRAAILARLARGETQLVSNMGILCEGWDMPACKCMLLARPTKSLALFMQMGGRILRPYCEECGRWCGTPGHASVTPVILDHAGSVDRHGHVHEDREWSLDAKPKRIGNMPSKTCPGCFTLIAASLGTCPHCGYEYPPPAPPPPPEPELTHVELALRTLDGDDAQRSFFARLAKTALDRGWKAGAVNHKFEERFGSLPPKEWYLKMKRAMRKDVPESEHRARGIAVAPYLGPEL